MVSFALFGLILLYWTCELPCQGKLPEFHCIPILGCIRVFWLVLYPLGLELDKALFGWNSVKKLCGWLLDWNTGDGVFGHWFLVLTWNLSCHAHITANIWLCEIEWSSTFDAFEIYFAHMKMDQTGDEAKYSCHLYSNLCCPLICPVLVLAFYFSCCCNLPQNGQSWLFPGWDQYQRFLEMLSHLIQDHETEVSGLGVNPKMIGTHSIRKGAVTHMSSLPGGPSISSVCICAGWTMGTMKDVYMQYL